MKRKNFLKGALALGIAPSILRHSAQSAESHSPGVTGNDPVIISTWNHGIAANAEAYKTIKAGGSALDAVEAGVKITEADVTGLSVGIGGLPDTDGHVTLDACIMDHELNCGSVAFVQNYRHVISIARYVMEKTPHVMIVGDGAEQLAAKMGLKKEELLVGAAKKAFEKRKKEAVDRKNEELDQFQKIDKDNHDTIGLLALDTEGRLSGACTTSGAAWKLHGRVGDSPIIGAGLYVDNNVGAATATGWGEAVIRICGSHMVVELMRQGLNPQQACEAAVKRILTIPAFQNTQVGFIALDKKGNTGAYSIQGGFTYALHKNGQNKEFKAGSEKG